MKDFEKMTAPRGNINAESWFIESYRRHQGHPIKILISLYKGNYHKFVLAVITFFIKHSCVWVLPIVTANIINDVTTSNPNTIRNIIFYVVLESASLTAQAVLELTETYLPLPPRCWD